MKWKEYINRQVLVVVQLLLQCWTDSKNEPQERNRQKWKSTVHKQTGGGGDTVTVSCNAVCTRHWVKKGKPEWNSALCHQFLYSYDTYQ